MPQDTRELPAASDGFTRFLGGTPLSVVRLDTPLDVLVRRVRARDAGPELDEHLALIAAAEEAGPPPFEHHPVAAGERPAAAVAADVLAAAGW